MRGYRQRALSASGLDRVGVAWGRLPERARGLTPIVLVVGLAVTYPFYVASLPTNIPVILTFPPLHDAVTILVFVMMAVGLNIVVGYAGLLDLGYVAFYAIGAYTAGWLASGQFQQVYAPRNYIVCGQAGPLGWEVSACTGAKLADPAKEVVGIVGDYSFQFLIEELAVAAQYHIPFVMILLNNAYLGLIRQAERAYRMDYEVQLAFANVNAPEIGEYGVDHVRAAEAFGCCAVRVFAPEKIAGAIAWARRESAAQRLPVIVEIITERVTDIAMGAEIDAITEFEEVIDLPAAAALEPV